MTILREWELTVPDGWMIRLDDEFVLLEHSGGSATVRVQSFHTAASGLEPRQWVALTASINSRRGRPSAPVDFGPFSGHRSQLAIEGDVIISWSLASETMGVDATYRALAANERLELEADAIVSSLRPCTRATTNPDNEPQRARV